MVLTTDSLRFIKPLCTHKTIYLSLVFEAFPAPVQAVWLCDHHRYVYPWLFTLLVCVQTLLFFRPPFYAFSQIFLPLLANAKGSFSLLPKKSNTAPIGSKMAAKSHPFTLIQLTTDTMNIHPKEYQYKASICFILLIVVDLLKSFFLGFLSLNGLVDIPNGLR